MLNYTIINTIATYGIILFFMLGGILMSQNYLNNNIEPKSVYSVWIIVQLIFYLFRIGFLALIDGISVCYYLAYTIKSILKIKNNIIRFMAIILMLEILLCMIYVLYKLNILFINKFHI